MLTDEELAFVIMELETKGLSPEIYRYRTKWGLSVVYYIFDTEKLENLVFEPVYMHIEDVECWGRSEDELFQIILENTVTIMQTKIIPYSTYLEEFESRCYDCLRLELIKRIVEAMERTEEENKLWCITSTIRERGTTGSFHISLLKKFCREHHFQQLLLGFSNNDFTFLSGANEEWVANMHVLVARVSHVIDEEDVVVKKKVLLYDFQTDTLEELEGEDGK